MTIYKKSSATEWNILTNKGELVMKKIFKLQDLDCAHCAEKMERAIAKLDGVNSVAINFMAQKMVIDAEDEKFDEVMKNAVKECKNVEPDCEIIM